MSRVGKNPIPVLKGVKVAVDAGNVSLEGPKGKLELRIPHGIKVEHKDENLIVTRVSDSKQNRSNHGTIRARLANMIKGVAEGHKKDLELQGIGFRAQLQGNKITFSLGLSHPVEFVVPKEVQVAVPTQTSISLEGPDNVAVGQVAAKIRALKPAEPYKGKGIRYAGEQIRRKQGKSIAK